MDHLPTDLEIIEDIYYRYYDEYKEYAKDEPDRIARIRVPVDIKEIAEACGVEEDMIFGRIFYHFNKKYSYTDENGKRITFFASVKFDGLSINFPMVASILADLKMEQRNFRIATTLAATSLLISAVTLTMVLFL